MPRLILSFLVCLALSACGRLPSVPGAGLFVRDRPATTLAYEAVLISPDGSDRFQVAIRDGGAPLEAVRESVRFPATRYCLRHAGSTDVAWNSDAGDPSAWRGVSDGAGRTIYQGRCAAR